MMRLRSISARAALLLFGFSVCDESLSLWFGDAGDFLLLCRPSSLYLVAYWLNLCRRNDAVSCVLAHAYVSIVSVAWGSIVAWSDIHCEYALVNGTNLELA